MLVGLAWAKRVAERAYAMASATAVRGYFMAFGSSIAGLFWMPRGAEPTGLPRHFRRISDGAGRHRGVPAPPGRQGRRGGELRHAGAAAPSDNAAAEAAGVRRRAGLRHGN